MTSKRARSTTPPASLSPSPLLKASRPSASPPPPSAPPRPESTSALIQTCTLPPTCNPPKHPPTKLPGDPGALERHHALYHTHVCAWAGCECVFPDAQLLDLHQTECHDPLAAVRKERGEKIFACFAAECDRCFLSPKARRLHLIQAHGYPKQYFFAVTNKGIGGLLRKFGEGASLVRRAWRPRPGQAGDDDPMNADENASSEEDGEEDGMAHDAPARTVLSPVKQTTAAKLSPNLIRAPPPHLIGELSEMVSAQAQADADVDALASQVSAMQLVPQHPRFGRGAARGFTGSAPRGGPRGSVRGQGRGKPRRHSSAAGAGGNGARGGDAGEDGKMDVVAASDTRPDAALLSFVPHSVRARAGKAQGG